MNYFGIIVAYIRKFDQNKLELAIISAYVVLSYVIIIAFLSIGQVFPVGTDPVVYLSVAENFANGPKKFEFYDPLSDTYMARWSPLYPLFIAILILSGFDVITAALIITIGFQGLVVFPLFYLTKNLFHRTIAHVSAIIYITSFPFIYVSTFPVADTLFTFFVVLSVFMLSKSLRSTNIMPTFITGIIVGLSYLTKPLGAVIFAFSVFCFIIYQNNEEFRYLRLLLTLFIFGSAFFVLIISWTLALFSSNFGIHLRLAGFLIFLFALLFTIYFNSKDKKVFIKKLRKIFFFLVSCITILSWWLVRNFLKFNDPLYSGQAGYFVYWFHNYGFNIFKAIEYSFLHMQIITRIILIDLFPLSAFLLISAGFFLKNLQKRVVFLFIYPIFLLIFLSVWYVLITRLLLSVYPLLIIIETEAVFKLRRICQSSFKRNWPQFVILGIFVIHIIYNLVFSYIYFTTGIQILNSTGLEPYNTINRPDLRL